MIVGVGVDVVDIARFAESLRRTPALRERLFASSERGLSIQSLAANLAAKEAIAKALGAPVDLGWHDAEVERCACGQPRLLMRGSVLRRAKELGAQRAHLSLAHDAGVATAFVVLEGPDAGTGQPVVGPG